MRVVKPIEEPVVRSVQMRHRAGVMRAGPRGAGSTVDRATCGAATITHEVEWLRRATWMAWRRRHVIAGSIRSVPLSGSANFSANDASSGSRLRRCFLPAGPFAAPRSSSSPISPRLASKGPDDSAGESAVDPGVKPGSLGVSTPTSTILVAEVPRGATASSPQTPLTDGTSEAERIATASGTRRVAGRRAATVDSVASISTVFRSVEADGLLKRRRPALTGSHHTVRPLRMR